MARQRVLSTLVVLSVLLGAVFVLPAAPAAAATCSGEGCTGQNPHVTGCDRDARNYATAPIKNSAGVKIGRVELRGSPSCHTHWARVTSWIGYAKIESVIIREDGVSDYEVDYNVTQAFSMMVYAPYALAIACGELNDDNLYCTDWA